MRSIKNIFRFRRLLMTLAFIASLLEWCAIVRSENTETTMPMTIGTEPQKIRMAIGGSANITCRSSNSSMIYFEKTTLGKTIRQPSDDIIIIDERTAILSIRNASEHKFQYVCKSESGQAIGKTDVIVGSPPSEIKDFTCRSYDFQYMTCTFTRPENFIYTEYELNYTDSPNKFCSETCKDLVENENELTCNLTMRRDSFYVIMQDMYYFNLTGRNELGTKSQIFQIIHSNVVIPAKLDIKIENITVDSVTLTWQNYKYEFYKGIPLDYEIELRPKGLEVYYATDYEQCNEKKCVVIIKNLSFAYYPYLLRVRAKVKDAPNINNMWSEPFEKIFRTKEKLPDYPPSTAPGSFYKNSDLQLYWKELLEHERNGPGFYYNVTEADTNGNYIASYTAENSTIKSIVRLSSERVYHIRAANNLGQSSHASAIKVYSDRGEDYRPIFVAKVYKNDAYVLSWRQPKKFKDLMNYTIFWCKEERATINGCWGTINFKIVDKSYQKYKLMSVNESFNLAVSANYYDYSTGMNWACNADESMTTTFEPHASALSATSIIVEWSINRGCSSIIQGYNLTYCQTIKWNKSKDCITEPLKLHLNGEQKNFKILDLNPYSEYRINVTMLSKKSIAKEIFAATTEAAPTEPRNLTLIGKTSHSATISWLPPEKFNGKLLYYTINAESRGKFLSARLNNNNTMHSTIPLKYTFNDLKDYTEYVLYVTAHTVESSPPSDTIKMKTLIGKLKPPLIDRTVMNGIVNWTAPSVQSGRIAYYEVALSVKRDDNKTIEKIVRTKNFGCNFRAPECHGSAFYYLTKVRAIYVANASEIDTDNIRLYEVNENETTERSRGSSNTQTETENLYLECEKLENIDIVQENRNELRLSSEWETGHVFDVPNCPVKFSTFSSIAIIIFFVTLMASAYGGCKKYKKMNNIDVVLPSGLVDHLSAYKSNNVGGGGGGGYGSKSDKDPSDISRSNDCLVNNKENFHLLESLDINSANGITPMIDRSIDNARLEYERGDYNHQALQREENSNGSYDDQNSSQSTNSVEINDMSSVSYTNGSNINDFQLENGSVFPHNIVTVPALNGYVSITPANDVNIGYITADKINSFQTNFHQDDDSKKNGGNGNDINTNNSTNMYVTPSQLAQIGRSERMH